MSFLNYISNYKATPLDLSTWQEFPLSRYFKVVQSDGDNQAQKLEEGDIPLISAGRGQHFNGIAKYIHKGDGISQLFPGNVLTVDMFGKAFFQPKPFYAVSHARVSILLPLEGWPFNKKIALFLVAVMDSLFRPRYSYGEMCGATALEKEKIFLPSLNGEPNWSIMEEYINSVWPIMESLIK